MSCSSSVHAFDAETVFEHMNATLETTRLQSTDDRRQVFLDAGSAHGPSCRSWREDGRSNTLNGQRRSWHRRSGNTSSYSGLGTDRSGGIGFHQCDRSILVSNRRSRGRQRSRIDINERASSSWMGSMPLLRGQGGHHRWLDQVSAGPGVKPWGMIELLF